MAQPGFSAQGQVLSAISAPSPNTPIHRSAIKQVLQCSSQREACMVGSKTARWVPSARQETHTLLLMGFLMPHPPQDPHSSPTMVPAYVSVEAQTLSCSKSTWGVWPPARTARMGLRRMMRNPRSSVAVSPLLLEGEKRASRHCVRKGARDVCNVLGKNSVRLEDGPRVHAPRSSCPTDCPHLPAL